MVNMKNLVLDAVEGEEIEAVLIGKGERAGDHDTPYYEILPWEIAKVYLDYEYDNGYGGTGCDPFYLWTSERVLFVASYDGVTSIQSVPRYPIDCSPYFVE